MSFSSSVKATPHLEHSLKKGLGALTAADSAHITVGAAVKLLGSINLDASLREAQPNDARWDYLVGQKAGSREQLHWIEIHPASGTGNIGEMEAKLRWLAAWMRTTPLASYPKQIVWIASGKSAFNSRNPGLRALASRGLRFVGGHLKLANS
jgi:hypothetical protein